MILHMCLLTTFLTMGWLQLVGFLKWQVSSAEHRFFYRALLQKRPIILRSLLIAATLYEVATTPEVCRVSDCIACDITSSRKCILHATIRVAAPKMCRVSDFILWLLHNIKYIFWYPIYMCDTAKSYRMPDVTLFYITSYHVHVLTPYIPGRRLGEQEPTCVFRQTSHYTISHRII